MPLQFSQQDVACGLIVIKKYMDNIKSNQMPKGLEFVLQKDINAIEQSYKTRYAQKFPKTNLQKVLVARQDLATKLSREETFDIYRVKEENLFVIYKILEDKAVSMGINIEYVDMTVFSEDDYYENDFTNDEENEKHTETARSDGKNLLLEKDLVKAGGIQGRMYDLLHLAFGHMMQWSTNEINMLLTKEEAWEIGYRNHEESPDVVVDLMSLYEFEAGMQGIEALQQALDISNIEIDQKENILQYFVDYAYADRGYIIQHYRGNHESFQKFWEFGQDIPPRQNLPYVKEFIERHTVEIGLIHDKQK